jgi:branched-chain amino acid aminotransferase
MYVATCAYGQEVCAAPLTGRAVLTGLAQWQPGGLRPYGPLAMSPAAGVLNYGQGLFEGMKAYRTVAGRVVLFRPDQVRLLLTAPRGCRLRTAPQNAERNAEGAVRMSMPPVPKGGRFDACFCPHTHSSGRPVC